MAYEIFDRKKVYKKGLNKAFLRTVPTKRMAKVYISNDPSAYIVKKIGNPKKKK